jgi:glycosyltransferase involved in cell wall biosynthesis
MIVINATQIHQAHSGVGVYTYKVIEKLIEKLPGGVIFTQWNIFRREQKNWKIIEVKHIRRGLIRWIWIQFVFLSKLRKNEILYCPYSEAPITKKVRSVITVHDLIPLNFPKQHSYKLKYYYKYFLPRTLKRAGRIISISETTRKDIIKYFPNIDENKITVIYNGYDSNNFNTDIDAGKAKIFREKYGIKDYLLYVGRLSKMKNVLCLIKAFYSIADKIQHSLVIIGRDESNLIKDAMVYAERNNYDPNRMKFIEFMDEKELSTAYKGARLLVIPSLGEGFGMPVIEAMACGVPVIISDIPSLKEITSDCATKFNPFSHTELSEKIMKLLSDEKLWNTKRYKGLERARDFSWDKTAGQIYNVIMELYDGQH